MQMGFTEESVVSHPNRRCKCLAVKAFEPEGPCATVDFLARRQLMTLPLPIRFKHRSSVGNATWSG
jgi:hypothetical protein